MKQNNEMTWHELYERLTDDQCPICRLMLDRISQHMDSFLYESVTDRDLRKTIREERGFCNFHAHMLLKKGDPLAHALVYADLIGEAAHHLQSKKAKPAYQHHEGCIFCKQANDAETRYLSVFADGFGKKDFATQYTKSGLMCVPHLELIRNQKHKANVAVIIQITLQKYEMLLSHLSELRRKHDYRFNREPWTDEEKAAWSSAVDVLVAKEGIRS